MNQNWKQAALEKIAASQTPDDQAVAEAFAQQAYTIIGNRCRALMKEPHMLGFEIVHKNEENTRLIGVFAFRTSEILLAPVFYLNGQVKGQNLLYRKGVNRFVPNNEKWVEYLISLADDTTGRGVSRNQGRARIHMDMNSLTGGDLPMKRASDEEGAAEKVDIAALWKEAAEAWVTEAPEHLFADLVVEQGLQKEASELVSRAPWIGDMLEVAGSLNHLTKQASAPEEPEVVLSLHTEPQDGWNEKQASEFWKQGFLLQDKRDMKGLSRAYVKADACRTLTGVREAGLQTAADVEGNKRKVLWGPTCESNRAGGYPVGCSGSGDDTEYLLVVMDGPDKGTSIYYLDTKDTSKLPYFEDDATDPTAEVKGEKPVAGKAYAIWLPGLRRFLSRYTIIRTIERKGQITRINFGDSTYGGDRLIVRHDLEESDERDISGDGGPSVIAGDAVFIPLDAAVRYIPGNPETPANIEHISPNPPAEWLPLTLDRLEDALVSNKAASITLHSDGRYTDILLDGRVKCRDLDRRSLLVKLARDLNLSAPDAFELADQALAERHVEFALRSPRSLVKVASTYYDREINPDEFEEYDYDGQLDLPVQFGNPSMTALAVRHNRTSPQRNYLDALGYSGGRNGRHGSSSLTVPDEMLLAMQNPMQELMEIGQATGVSSLIDHGAVGSMVKTFDAKPFIHEYVGKLEASLDYLARLLFMLFWKPKDFAQMFGSDDLPLLENKLDGVFTSYGDLVLELKQSAGDPE